MDLRNIASRATDKIKSVFSRDNSFFYGTSEHRDQYEHYQPDNQYEQENPYVQQAPYMNQPQQPAYQGAPQQGYQQQYQQQYQQPMQQQQYAQPGQQMPPQASAWQAQNAYAPYYQEQQTNPYAPHAQGISPQQMQLKQEQEPSGRNRRAAQHQQTQPDGTILPFPGTEENNSEAPRMDAYVVNVQNISGCRQAMTCLRKNQCTLVVMDQLIDKAEVRRYVDMLNGACFALGGTMTRLSSKIGFYLLAPAGMMVYTDPVTASANAPQRPLQVPPVQAAQQPAYPNQAPYYNDPQQVYQPPYPQQQYAPQAQPGQQQDPYTQQQYVAQRFA